MPQMGYDMQEGTLIRWLKDEGSNVDLGEPVAEIETDKAVVEFESYASGVLQKILVAEGSTVPVGEAIAVVGEAVAAPPAAAPEPEPVVADAGESAQPSAVPESSAPEESAPAAAIPLGAASEPVAPAEAAAVVEAPPAPAAPPPPARRVLATPIARQMARDAGIDLADVEGSGPGGRIVREDVAAAIAAMRAAEAEAAAAEVEEEPAAPEPVVEEPAAESDETPVSEEEPVDAADEGEEPADAEPVAADEADEEEESPEPVEEADEGEESPEPVAEDEEPAESEPVAADEADEEEESPEPVSEAVEAEAVEAEEAQTEAADEIAVAASDEDEAADEIAVEEAVDDVEPEVEDEPAPEPEVAVEAASEVEDNSEVAVGYDAGDSLIPLSRARRQIARVTARSKSEKPHFYVNVDIDMTAAMALRGEINSALAGEGVRVTVNDMIIAASVIALKRFPKFNAYYEEGGIRMNDGVNVGVAMALDEGLIMPAIVGAGDMSLRRIALATKDLSERARAGSLSAQEYSGGTFAISNMGMMGVTGFVAIIQPPQTAVLAIGAVQKRAVVTDDDQITVRQMMTATLSADHRIVDGAEGATFVNEIKALLENPLSVIL